ncbi:MAG: cytochrome c [Sediminibacterium sp.]|nr:cytochrome c [Sediminibacterium sp.]
MKKIVLLATVVIGSVAVSFTVFSEQQVKPWPVPEASKKLKSTVASDPATLAEAKTLWNTHCKSCHGGKGLGDGSKAAQLKTEPGDFSTPDFQSQTDGSLFYKLSEGREDMPSFKKKLPDVDERWVLINFMRTLKK